MNKPKLAIVSSYDQLCGIASYTRAVEESMSEHFDVTVLPINMNPAVRSNPSAVDMNFEEICKRLPSFDLVNIQHEFSLFGGSADDATRRTIQVIEASPRVIMTFHTTDRNVTRHEGIRQKIRMLLSDIRHRRYPRIISGKRDDSREVLKEVVSKFKALSKSKPYHIIVHAQVDADHLKNMHHVPAECLTAYPLVFLSNEKCELMAQQTDAKSWRVKNGIPEDVEVIGFFGFLGKYKGIEVVIRALTLLPKKYVLAIVGGQHPMLIKQHGIDENILSLQTMLTDPEDRTFTQETKEDLLKRIFFIGPQKTDDEMMKAIQSVDTVVLPYLEVGQSASGPASLSLELGKKMVLSRTITFAEFEKFYPNSFESFDIGNALELKHKIMNYDANTLENRKIARKKYNAEGLVALFHSKYASWTAHE